MIMLEPQATTHLEDKSRGRYTPGDIPSITLQDLQGLRKVYVNMCAYIYQRHMRRPRLGDRSRDRYTPGDT